jgi:hypothetical protein
MTNKLFKSISLFLWILYLIGYPGISLPASECSPAIQCSFNEPASEAHECTGIEAPIQDSHTDNVLKIRPNTGKILLYKDNDYTFILSDSECLDKLQIAYHHNIDGLYSYLVQRIII